MATTRVAAAPMRVAQVGKPGGDLEIVEREIPKPVTGHVRIKVQACGICGSDALTKEGRAIQGWASGTPADEEDTLNVAELTGVRPMIETYPLEKAAEGYARMRSGEAQFRVVLTM